PGNINREEESSEVQQQTAITMDNTLHYTSVNHAYHLIGSINQLRKKSELCDIILNCSNTKIPAHKLILSVSSPYFNSLMNLRPEISNSVSEIHLNGIDSNGVMQIIEFFYTSAISVTEENVWSLLPAASLLQAEEIQNLCCDFLSTQLQVETCLRIHKIATRCLCSGLLSETTEFIKENFDKVIEEEAFLDLGVDELFSHMKRMNEVVLTDERMLQAFKCWIIHSIDDRQVYGLKIIKQFPKLEEKLLNFIPMELLMDGVEEEESSLSSPNQVNPSARVHHHGNDLRTNSPLEGSPAKGADNSRVTESMEEDGHMCFECAEVFDTKNELDNHVKTHKLFGQSAGVDDSMASEGQNNSTINSSTSPNPVGSSASFAEDVQNRNFAKSLSSLYFDSNSTTTTSSLFDDYMRSRGLDGPEFGVTAQSTPKPNYTSLLKTHQLTITATNSKEEGSQLNFICPVCGKTYDDQETLGKHLESHTGFDCKVCGKSYTTKSNLQTHMRKHNGDKPYNCTYCDKCFTSLCVLKVHLRTHTGEKPFVCPTCGVSFAKNIHLKRHLSIHTGIKPHECKICNKRFSRSDHLKRHVQSIHTQDRPHICSLCGKDFVRKYELNKHMKQLHWGFTVGDEGNDSLENSLHDSLLNPSGASLNSSDAINSSLPTTIKTEVMDPISSPDAINKSLPLTIKTEILG
ncbi:zinc finger protein 3 homolog, partial [Mizuhopecten yessoensis]